MAKLLIKFNDEKLKRLRKRCAENDAIIQKMLVDGAKPLEEKMKSNLEAVIGHGIKGKSRSNGDLIRSVKVTKTYPLPNGEWNIKVGIYGKDRNGVSNATKAMILEFGRTDRLAKPWLKPAINASRKAVVKAMMDRFEKEIK